MSRRRRSSTAEPDEVEAVARSAAAGTHRHVTRLRPEPDEIAARAREDTQDAELIRIAAFTGLRLGELPVSARDQHVTATKGCHPFVSPSALPPPSSHVLPASTAAPDG